MTLELRLSLLGLAFSMACSTPDSLDSSDDISASSLKTKKCHDHDHGHGNGHGYGHGKGHEDCDDEEEKPIAPWKFVSIPDFLNSDIADVSNLTSAVNSTNALHEAAIARVLDEIAAENPDFVMVAGDLVNGHWYLDASGVQVFGPVATRAQKQAAIAKAADVYYTTWKERFESRGLTVYPAVGDHDIGDNDWAANSEKAFLVPDYKAQFAKHFTLDENGQPIYARRPVGTPFEKTSYAIRHKNLELVTLDEFRQDSPTTQIDPQRGSVRLSVDGDHLAWLDRELTDATESGKIKHVMVQGHIPVLTPVRTQNSSGMTMPGGAQTPFWQTLVGHHVDLYVAGEVHDMSANNNGGVEQAVHGAIMGYADDGSYMVGTVYPDRIELELKRFKMDYPSTEKLWQAGSNRPKAQYSVRAEPFESVGTLVIDKSSGQTQFLNRTGYFIPMNEGGGDQQPAPAAQGLAVHMKFDETPGSTTAVNSGTAGAIHNGAISGATYVAGRLGNAVRFDALDQIVAGPSPIAGSAARTTSAWVKVSPSTEIRTAFTFGKNTDGGKWDFDLDVAGNLEVGVGNGRIDSAGSQNIADGAWHNVTAVLPAGGTLAAAKLYVDGAPISFTAPTKAINTVATGTFIIGHGANAASAQPFAGDLDDLAIWARPLGPAEVKAMVSLAGTAGLGYDAGKADKLLTAFASATNVQIDGVTWKYWPSGLTGPEGIVQTTATSRYEINLGGGAGVVVPADPNAEPPPAPLASGLAVHLAFDDAAGSLSALNTGTSGTLANGAVTGAAFVAGKLGNAVQIDGQDHIIAGPTPVTGAAARTTSVWVKLPGASSAIRTAFTFGQNSNGGKWDVDIDTAGNFELGIANGRTDSAGSPNVADGAWHNLTAVLPSGATTLAGAKFYVDGAPIAFTATSAQAINTATGGSLIVGHSANSSTFQQFAGDIDDLAIWTRPLGATEVAAMVSLANTAGLAYDAGKVDTLLSAFASASDVTIDGVSWTYRASGLTGAAGVVQTTSTNRYEINLGGGAGFVVATDPDPVPVTGGLTVHLAFDEASGTTAINGGVSGATNDGAITGAAYVPGKLGSAVQFAGLDRIVAGPTPVSGSATRTTSVWVRLPGPSTAIRTALTFGTNATGSKWDVDVDVGGNFELGIAGGRTDSAGSPNVADGAWHNLTAVLPSGATTLAGARFYVDGAPISFTATSSQLIKTAATGSLIIGHAANSLNFQQFAGEIDDVAIWARPLSAVEVRAMVSLANTAGLNYNAGDLEAMLTAFRAGSDVVIDGTTWKYRASGVTGGGVVGVGTGGNLYELELDGGAGFVVPLGTATSDALAVHLAFDEAAGSPIALNSGTSGAANNGSISGTEFVAGKLGNAVQFAGLDRITAGFAPITGAAARTTSVWVKLPGPSTAIRTAFAFGTNSSGQKWDVDIDVAGNFEIGVAGGRIDSAGSQSVADGAWHNVTAVLPSGANKLTQMQLYVDGSPIAFTAPSTPTINTSATGAFIVGQSVNSSSFQQLDGQLDDLAIWNRPLGAIEVRAFVSLANTLHYDAGKAEALLNAFSHGSGVVLDGRAWVYRASGLAGAEGSVEAATGGFTYTLNLGGGAGLAAVN